MTTPSHKPVTPTDREWQAVANKLSISELDRVRSIAEKWGATITALTGLAGTVLVVKGRESISELTHNYQILAGICLLAAFACAAFSIYLAATAAQGSPKLTWNTGDETRKAFRNNAKKAVTNIFWSRTLALIFLLSIIAAVAITWFSTATKDVTSGAIIHLNDDTVKCGVVTTGDDNLLMLDNEAISDLKSIEFVEKCPGES